MPNISGDRRRLVAPVIVALALAACGPGGPGTDEPGQPTPANTPAPPAATPAPADTPVPPAETPAAPAGDPYDY